ncbi:MAG TPA: hypothetical protein VGF40_09010 [Thermoanaerobaculia bacterium]
MIRAALAIVAAAATVASWPVFRPSNSERLTERGREAFAAGRFGDAAASLDEAARIEGDAIARFNQGTAKVAAGDAAGAPILEQLGSERQPVGGDALFNLGNAALLARRYDDAIARYVDVLRRSPGDADAKRNLEIALRRKQQQEEQKQQGNRGRQQPQPAPQPGENEPQQAPPEPGEGKERMSAEEILRSIAQQEKEELRRMRLRKSGEERPIGW